MKRCLSNLVDECANLAGGSCLASASGLCLVRSGQRCGYFESSVLGLAELRPEFAGAEREYWARKCRQKGALSDHPFVVNSAPKARGSGPQCADCGWPRGKGRRYCPACAQERQRGSARERFARHYRKTKVRV